MTDEKPQRPPTLLYQRATEIVGYWMQHPGEDLRLSDVRSALGLPPGKATSPAFTVARKLAGNLGLTVTNCFSRDGEQVHVVELCDADYMRGVQARLKSLNSQLCNLADSLAVAGPKLTNRTARRMAKRTVDAIMAMTQMTKAFEGMASDLVAVGDEDED